MAALDAHSALGSSVGHRDLVVGVPVSERKPGLEGVTRMQVLAAIARYQDETDWFPSMREIGLALNLRSTNTVWWHVRKLVDDWLVEQNPTHSQMRITEAGRQALPIPYLPAERANQ